jgi:hypothetical protein
MDAGLTGWLFWASLAFSLAVAFVVTVPVNRWLIGRDKGHAVVHQYHHGAHSAIGPEPHAPGHLDHEGHGRHGP